MMTGNAAKTKDAILRSAIDEFAAHGLSGGRVERIASSAGVSKPMIYSYFGNKDMLFDAAYGAEVHSASSAIEFDVNSLAEYAVRMHDYYDKNPNLWRLISWAKLERGLDAMEFEGSSMVRNRKISLIFEAQSDGKIGKLFPPNELLRIIVTLSQMWCGTERAPDISSNSARREAVRNGVKLLLNR